MSNKENKVIDMTATENENNVADLNNELNELRESNKNLIAERDTLMSQVKELEDKLAETTETKNRMYGYWQREERKVELLMAFFKSGIKGTEYMSAAEFIEKVVQGI